MLGLGLTLPVVGARRLRAAPSIDARTVWLDASVLTGLKQERTGASATTPSTGDDPVGSWLATGLSSAWFTAPGDTARPTLRDDGSNHYRVEFDGSNDYLASAASLGDEIGSLWCAFRTGATAFATRGVQVLFSSADEGAADEWFEIGLTAEGRVYIERNASGTKHTVVCPTFLVLSTAYTLALVHDGVDYYAQINGAEENPLMITNIGAFGWFGDVAGADNLVLAGTVTSGGLQRPFQGDVYEAALFSTDITA